MASASVVVTTHHFAWGIKVRAVRSQYAVAGRQLYALCIATGKAGERGSREREKEERHGRGDRSREKLAEAQEGGGLFECYALGDPIRVDSASAA